MTLFGSNLDQCIMDTQIRSKVTTELIWFFGIIVVSAALEYAIITLFDLHPIFGVKIQGLIGLVVIAYGIRMIARMSNQGLITLVDDDEKEPENNG